MVQIRMPRHFPGRIKSPAFLLGLSFSLLISSGCGSSGPRTMQAGGTVTFKNAPLTSGTVRFNPVDPKNGHMAEGPIGSDGKFKLSTFKTGDGVLAGDYDVTVISMVPSDKSQAKDKELGIGNKSAIPEKYNSPKTSGLKETINAGESKTNLQLDLTE